MSDSTQKSLNRVTLGTRLVQALSLTTSLMFALGPIGYLCFLHWKVAFLGSPDSPTYPVTQAALNDQLESRQQSLVAEIKTVKGVVDGVKQESRDIKSKVDGLAGRPEQPHVPSDLSEKLGSLETRLGDLDQGVKNLSKKLSDPAASKNVKSLPNPLPPVDLSKIELRLTNIEGKLQRIQAPAPVAEPRVSFPCDTIVVALNSYTLPMQIFMSPRLEQLFVDTGLCGIGDDYRVGLYVVTTASPREIVALGTNLPAGKMQEQFRQPLPPVQSASEDLASVAPQVPGWFAKAPPSKNRRRLIIIASFECRPPGKFPGWDDLSVDAVLLPSANKAADAEGEQLRAWRDFCFQHHGVMVLSPPKLDLQDDGHCGWLQLQLYHMIYPQMQFRRQPSGGK